MEGAWWEVDLGPTDAIATDQFKEVRIYNRDSGNGREISRLSNAEVSLLNENGGIVGQYTLGSVYWHEITLSAFDFGIGPASSTQSEGIPVNNVLVHYSVKSSFGCINSAVARVDDMLIYDVSVIQPICVHLIYRSYFFLTFFFFNSSLVVNEIEQRVTATKEKVKETTNRSLQSTSIMIYQVRRLVYML